MISVTDNVGEHNSDLDVSSNRILEGGSWKRQRVIMLLPSAPRISSRCAQSIYSISIPPNQAFHRVLLLGMEVGEAYSNAIAQILSNPELSTWDYILTVEEDNLPQQDALVRLIAQMEKHPELAAIGGLYWTKGLGGVPQIWGDVRDPIINFRPQVPVPNQLVECVGTAMGFTLYRLSMFKDARLRRPWFRTLNGTEGLGIGTQDLYFWGNARPFGYRCAIDCGVLVGHYDLDGKFGPPDKVW